MATLNNLMLDNGLSYATTGVGQATTIYLNNTEATDFADASSGANSLGNVAVGTMNITDGPVSGRAINFGASNNGSVTAAGPTQAAFISLCNASTLLATTSISNPQDVSSGQTFDLNPWIINYLDPVNPTP